jgi:hypothetical protein
MVPAEVFTDPRLTHRDVRVYCMLACSRRGPYASLGRQRLAKFVHADRRGIRASIRALVEFGHLEEKQEGRGRSRFKLLSRWFVGDAAKEAAPVVATGMPRCPRCSRSVRAVGKAGVCRSCAENERLVGRVAAARQELGATATAEQLAAHLKNERLAARIRRLLRPAA